MRSHRLVRVPINWNYLIDQDVAQSQEVGACRNRKSRATFSGHALSLRRIGAGCIDTQSIQAALNDPGESEEPLFD
jgi:hypothetical protein